MKRRIRVGATSSLLALGTVGLDACGGGDDKTVTGEVSATATEAVKVEKKSCGRYTRWTLVVEGDISCPEARRLFRGLVSQNPPPGWGCSGGDDNMVCTKGPDLVITATF
jgi:hypothetical protein